MKTLEKLKFPSDGCCCVDTIRQSAIEDAKLLIEQTQMLHLYNECVQDEEKYRTDEEYRKECTDKSAFLSITRQTVLDYIVKKFNITEEDLK